MIIIDKISVKVSKRTIKYYTLTYNDQSAFLTQLKKQEDTNWLKEINSQSLQFSLKCLESAYVGFFQKRSQFPRFKSKKSKNSFTCPQFVKTEEWI